MYGSGMDFTNVIGLAIRCKNGYLASNWQEKDCPELLKGTFEVLSVQKNSSTEEITQAEEIKPKEVKDIIKEESQDNQEVKSSEKQIESQEREEAIYRKIQLAHIRNLPPRNRYLCNNSFVLHGFFNYQYLILKVERIDNEESLLNTIAYLDRNPLMAGYKYMHGEYSWGSSKYVFKYFKIKLSINLLHLSIMTY